jgi:hypothetical protein
VKALEAEIEKWRLDYVSLIQSSIRFSGCDTIDDAELVLFGGDRVSGKGGGGRSSSLVVASVPNVYCFIT